MFSSGFPRFDQGNCLVYEYKLGDLSSVPLTLSEANRHSGIALFANKYLKKLHYALRQSATVQKPANAW
jgi:hypothetical protein